MSGALLVLLLVGRELARAGGLVDDEGARRIGLAAVPVAIVFALVVVLRLVEVVATRG